MSQANVSDSVDVNVPARPKSAVNNYINLVGVAGFFSALYVCIQQGVKGVDASLIVVLAYAVPVLLLEVLFLKTPKNPSTGLDFARRDTNAARSAVKLVGLFGSYGFVGLLYWLFPEYHGSFYDHARDAAIMIAPWLALAAVPYVVWIDARMREPEDSYYWFGKCLLLDFRGVNSAMMVQHVLGWLVKGFFLPLMFVSFVGNINYLGSVNYSSEIGTFKGFFEVTKSMLFTLDLLAAVAGYSLAIRYFDTHIRSSEPTLFGWAICLICYQPFLSVFMRFYLAYSSNDWFEALDGHPNLQIAWGSVALILLALYTTASINFGCRFSNITHRGVLTNGMYRFTKHPAYVTKNMFWWMMHVPFVPLGGWMDAVRYSILLVAINGVYYLRARTEERHLSRDPVYVQYALHMNKASVFSPLARRLPFLRYRAPVNWEKLPAPYMGIKN